MTVGFDLVMGRYSGWGNRFHAIGGVHFDTLYEEFHPWLVQGRGRFRYYSW